VHLLHWKPKYGTTGHNWYSLRIPSLLAFGFACYCYIVLAGVLPILWGVYYPLGNFLQESLKGRLGEIAKWACCFIYIMPWMAVFAQGNFMESVDVGYVAIKRRRLSPSSMCLRLGMEGVFVLMFTWLFDWGLMGLALQLIIQLVTRIGIYAVLPLLSHHGQPLKRDASTEKVFRLCETHSFPVAGLMLTETPRVFYHRTLLTEYIYIDEKLLVNPEQLLAAVAHGLGCRNSPVEGAAFAVLLGLINLLLSYYILSTGAFYELFGFTDYPNMVLPHIVAISISSVVITIGFLTFFPLCCWYTRNTVYAADRFVAAEGLAPQMIELLKCEKSNIFTACKCYEYISMSSPPPEARIDRLRAESVC
jgi:hypothetical protein